MADFLKLVQNENMKIYRRLRTWIMLGIVALLPIVISVLWRLLDEGELPTNWEVMKIESMILFMLITVFTVIIAADSVAGEFSWGTIKLLLIRPWRRSSILLSKYLSLIQFAIVFAATAYVVTLLVNMALFGYTSPDDVKTTLADGTASGQSIWLETLEFYGLEIISLIVIMAFAFMLSSAFRSGGLAIGLSIFLLLAGGFVTGLLSITKGAWVKYVFFLHTDLTSYMNGGKGPLPDQPMTLGFALSVLAVYFIIFNVVSWTVFMKRDVAA